MNKDNIKISGCILTRNDSQFIKDCINNIIPYVDEIVILDANDDDITENIIKNISSSSSKTIIYRRTAVSQNFSKDRNELQYIASGDYVLHVDCDEIFDKRLLSLMKYIIGDYLSRNILPMSFRFPRINHPDKINYPDYQIRLLNRKYTRWTRKVHEIPETIPTTREEIGMDVHNMVTLDYPITHLYKEKDELQKRWKELLYNNNSYKKLLIISIFKNSDKFIKKTLQCMNNLYIFNQNIDDNNKLDINYSFINENSNDGTLRTLENYVKEGYILNIQLRSFESYNRIYYATDKYAEYKRLATIRNYAIEQSVEGFPLSDDDYILFTDSDVEFNNNIVYELIKDIEHCGADIIAPMIYTGKDLYFYDIISYRFLDGSRINDSSPCNTSIDRPIEMSSVGSFYIMKYKVAKNIKYTGENDSEQVEFCNRARSQGFRIFVDPRLSVFHIWV